MGSNTRARDADRDQAVDVIEAAYADGQLSGDERESRVARALAARTLGELGALTGDLQRTSGAPAPAHLPAKKKPATALLLLPLVALLLGVWVLPKVLASDPETQRAVAVDSSEPRPEPIEEPWRPTAANLREFRGAYEKKFSSTEFYEFWINDDHVYVRVPTRDSRGREEGWDYDGEFILRESAESRDTNLARGDLKAFNVNRWRENVRDAVANLKVDNAVLDGTHVGPTEVLIWVQNDYDEKGTLHTRLDGEVTSRTPFGAE